MESEEGRTYRAAQFSAKEVIKANRRQYYCNIMNLLATSCKACGLIGTSFTNNELVEFWLCDILPLMFDSDDNIQASAIAALAEALVAIDAETIHISSPWTQIKDDINNKYLPLLHKMRDDKNSNWHKIWTLLVQIMDQELLRGCIHINKFLAVVEMGFRNSDNGVRSEAFLCWRILIKLFAAYEELTTAKRLRLILIPLRTSQSRSSLVSGIKLRVWWYLLTTLNEDLPMTFDNVLEYFFSFAFGSVRGSSNGLAHNYQTCRELALPCLVALWSVEMNDKLNAILRNLRLETLKQPSPLMQGEVMQQHWETMLAAAKAGIDMLLSDQNSNSTEADLLQMLLRNLTLAMFKFSLSALIVNCCNMLETTLKTDGRVMRSVFNICATENLQMHRINGEERLNVLEACMKLCIKAKEEVPTAILQRCVTLLFTPEQLQTCNQNEFRLLSSFAESIMQANDDEDYDTFTIKVLIWRQVSIALVSYLRDNTLEYRLIEKATLLDNWILWPLHGSASFTGRRINSAFESGFCEQWRQLLNAGHNEPERKKFMGEVKAALGKLLDNSNKDEQYFPELFDAYVNAVIKLGICKDTPLYKDVFALLLDLFKKQTVQQKTLEGCLNTLRNVIVELRQNELIVVFDLLKGTLKAAKQCWETQHCEDKFMADWKRTIQEHFRKQPMKSMANQIKDIFSKDDDFVIIPAVWSLNPEKLTDRQKERLAKKSDIPALYNDMSQSQDSSSIKPWTPKKVVIAKNKQTELALVGKTDDLIAETVPSETIKKTATIAKQRRQTIDSAIMVKRSDAYNFRKPRALAEEDIPNSSPATKEIASPRVTRNRTSENSSEKQKESPRGNAPTKSPTEKSKDVKVADSEIETEVKDPPQNLSEQTVPATQSIPETAAEVTQSQEMSPKRASTRLCNLNSPPDRKHTNNSSSPTLRPKPTAHMTGRGAQLINMIRNKKFDNNSNCSPSSQTTNSLAATKVQMTPIILLDRAELVSTPTSELNELAGVEHTSTPMQPKGLLTFSKRLPSPSASPSASILKRKLRSESVDDITMESPATKRKRVSFHDPPVSVTKEYLRDNDDSRNKLKRCLLMDKLAQVTDIRQGLKRRGRLDSIIEIEKFAKEQTDRTSSADKPFHQSLVDEDEGLVALQWNETHNNSTININSNETAEANNGTTNGSEMTSNKRDLAILDTNAALDLVVEQCSLETLLERYFGNDNGVTLKNANVLAKFLSSQMTANQKLKTNVLETLSENHSKDFLDHAIRENLSTVVCDRLNLNSVLEYTCAKSKINNTCRTNLLSQVPDIVKTCRAESERMNFLKDLLQQSHLNDDQILSIISNLMVSRDSREIDAETVAESAADSSSNL